MRKLKIGIGNRENVSRTVAATGDKGEPWHNEPEVWFLSLESFAKVLSDRNRALMKTIAEEKPKSLAELAKTSGRAKSNLSRTLHTLEQYGLVHLDKGPKGRIIPRTRYSEITLDLRI